MDLNIPVYFPKYKRKCGDILKDTIYVNLNMLETQDVVNFGKDGGRNMMKIRLTESCKSWIWDQHLPEKMK